MVTMATQVQLKRASVVADDEEGLVWGVHHCVQDSADIKGLC